MRYKAEGKAQLGPTHQDKTSRKAPLAQYILSNVYSHHSSARHRRSSLGFVGLNRHGDVHSIRPRSVCTRRPAAAGGAAIIFPSQPASNNQHISKRHNGGTIIISSRAISTKPPPNNYIHRPIIAYFPHYSCKYTRVCRVGTAVHRCKTRAMRAGMRLSIYSCKTSWRPTAYHNGEFFRILLFSAKKNGKNLWFHVLSLEYLSVAVFPLGS